MMKKFIFFTAALLVIAGGGCVKETEVPMPPPVENISWKRYLGKWYEIARLPNIFQRDGTSAVAEYILSENDPSKIFVINSSVDGRGRKVLSAEGRAFFLAGREKTGLLRVTFQWPFYGEYRIIYLSEDYKISIVTSSTRKLLWILSRTPKLSEKVKRELLQFLRKEGFAVEKLFWDRHS